MRWLEPRCPAPNPYPYPSQLPQWTTCLVVTYQNQSNGEVFNWGSKVIHHFALGLVQKTHATFSNNQMNNLNQLWFSSRFPAFHAVCFNLSSLWLMMMKNFALIGCCDYFGYGFGHSIENDSSLWSCMTLSTYLVPAVSRTLIMFKPGVWHYIPY